MSGYKRKFREISGPPPHPPPSGIFRRHAMLGPAVALSPEIAPDLEAWAEQYLRSTLLSHKLSPPAPPKAFRATAAPLRIEAPGRPPELRQARRGERTPKQQALLEPHYRARTLHAFLHHELQAAELM